MGREIPAPEGLDTEISHVSSQSCLCNGLPQLLTTQGEENQKPCVSDPLGFCPMSFLSWLVLIRTLWVKYKVWVSSVHPSSKLLNVRVVLGIPTLAPGVQGEGGLRQ